ncbi:MAG: Asp23/Gls24 family envelope stress response protein [Candidatus Dormibacteraeota bacterium]|uniref:Asp23/Gls24 family envelope stress response protein n=1 Tax=Candidatus Amunia macphersoniae TaxID=3127014 RepID=A0A934KFT6_9BACT|nr:Asp23/Gls24 family envelope stress response protein [Candidatus Dormibacteraeota bacterium]
MITDWAPDDLATEVWAADAAARAARAVSGVVRLQPGVWGLIRHLAARAFEQATGQALPDIAGVNVDLVDGGVMVEVQLVVDGGYQAAAVGAAVCAAVCAAVPIAVGHPVTDVWVHIAEIDLTLD